MPMPYCQKTAVARRKQILYRIEKSDDVLLREKELESAKCLRMLPVLELQCHDYGKVMTFDGINRSGPGDWHEDPTSSLRRLNDFI